MLDGKTLISEVNKLLNVEISEEDVDTIGGWLLTEKYDIAVGETLTFGPYVFTVKAFDGRQIKRIEVLKKDEENRLKKDEETRLDTPYEASGS